MTILERTQATVGRFVRLMDTTEHKETKRNFLYMAYGAVELADDLLWEEIKPALEDMVWGA